MNNETRMISWEEQQVAKGKEKHVCSKCMNICSYYKIDGKMIDKTTFPNPSCNECFN